MTDLPLPAFDANTLAALALPSQNVTLAIQVTSVSSHKFQPFVFVQIVIMTQDHKLVWLAIRHVSGVQAARPRVARLAILLQPEYSLQDLAFVRLDIILFRPQLNSVPNAFTLV
jgi:hypothetical protein